jgi:hypothetical protein
LIVVSDSDEAEEQDDDDDIDSGDEDEDDDEDEDGDGSDGDGLDGDDVTYSVELARSGRSTCPGYTLHAQTGMHDYLGSFGVDGYVTV